MVGDMCYWWKDPPRSSKILQRREGWHGPGLVVWCDGKRVLYDREKTRNQVMVRVGTRGEGEQCTGFKYGLGREYETEEIAMKAAIAWVKAGRPERQPA